MSGLRDRSEAQSLEGVCASLVSLHAVRNRPNSTNLILALVLTGAFSLYLAALTPASFGFYHDDSLYVVMAKAIATGQGYRIISLPNEPVQTKSPPFYPLLLSLIWRADPHFPGNLATMMMLSVLAALICLILIWLYLTKQGYASRWQALIVVGLVAINWRTTVLATGVYSEMFYTALSIAGLHLAEVYEQGKRSWIMGAGLGALMGLAFLTRTAGIVLLIAVSLYFIWRRQVRKLLLPLAVGSCFAVAWVGWGYVNRPASSGVNTAYYESYLRTFGDVISDLQSQNNSSKLMAFLSIIGRNAFMLVLVSIPLVCLAIDYDWPQTLGGYFALAAIAIILLGFLLTMKGFLRRSKGLRLMHIYVLLYLALHLAWPYSGYDRFLIPLLPFLLTFLLSEIEILIGLVRKELSVKAAANKISAVVVGLALAAIAGVATYNYSLGVYHLLGQMKTNVTSRALEDAEAVSWLNRNTDVSDVLVCYRDPMYFLYTGRKATRSSSLKEGGKLQDENVDRNERSKDIFRIIDENHAKYLILTSSDFELEHQADPYQKAYRTLLDQYPQVFVPVFRSSVGSGAIYRIYNHAN